MMGRQYRRSFSTVTNSGYRIRVGGQAVLALLCIISLLILACETEIAVPEATTGSIRIDGEPDNLGVPWSLAGPDAQLHQGQGDTTLTAQSAGEYTIEWQAVTGWRQPLGSTQTAQLTSGDTLLFTGVYELPGYGDIFVDADPDELTASWQLVGPEEVVYAGAGDSTLTDLLEGEYTITWEHVPCLATPPSATHTLAANETFTFRGEYLVVEFPMVTVPAGSFEMGSFSTEHGADGWETPRHHVIFENPFLMLNTEVTQGQYESVTGLNPSLRPFHRDWPVDNVSWFMAVEFCNRLSLQEGLEPAYAVADTQVQWLREATGFRLPTEAEWEYACRAGSDAAFANGGITVANPYQCDQDVFLEQIGWYCFNSWNTTPSVVGMRVANAWGLFDMHGNVWEWCWDWWGSYEDGTAVDPTGPDSGTFRVKRGGCFMSVPEDCRSAERFNYRPDSHWSDLGFRVVRLVE